MERSVVFPGFFSCVLNCVLRILALSPLNRVAFFATVSLNSFGLSLNAQSVTTWSGTQVADAIKVQGFIASANIGDSYSFFYGTDSLNLNLQTTPIVFSHDTTNVYVSAQINGLNDGNYFYVLSLLKADNSTQSGRMLSFRSAKAKAPEAQSLGATIPGSIEAYRPPSITLNGLVNPGSSPTKVYFEYGESEAYGQQTEIQEARPKRSAKFVEKFNDQWLGSWYSWGNLSAHNDDVESDGYARSHVPSLIDLNHFAEGSVGPISLVLYAYHSGMSLDGFPFRLGGERADLRDAQVSVRFRTNNYNHNGSKLSFWVQAQPFTKFYDPNVPASNWALTSLSMTDYTTPEWSTAEFSLTNVATMWKNAGTNFAATNPWRFSYEPLNHTLGNVNMDFIFVALDVDLEKPPSGVIDFDNFSMRYCNYSLLSSANGGQLINWPANTSADPFALTDGVRTLQKNVWTSNANPDRPQAFVYSLAKERSITCILIHQNGYYPSRTVLVSGSQDGHAFYKIDSLTLPEPFHPEDNRALSFSTYDVNTVRAKFLKFEIVDGYQNSHWGLGEIEVYSDSVIIHDPGDEYAGFNVDVVGLKIGQPYHYRIVAENALGKVYGEDRTFIISENAIEIVAPDTITVTDLFRNFQVDATWQLFNPERERIRFQLQGPQWVELNGNEGIISIKPELFTFKDTVATVIAFDQRGRTAAKQIVFKNDFYILPSYEYYVFQGNKISISSEKFPVGYWTGTAAGEIENGAYTPSTNRPDTLHVKYSTLLGSYVVSAPVTVYIKEKPVILKEHEEILCEGDSLVLTIGGSFAKILWSTGETANRIIVKKTGVYTAQVVDAIFGTVDLTPVYVEFTPRPQTPAIEFVRSKVIGSTIPCFSCEWTLSDTIELPYYSQQLYVESAGVYHVTNVDAFGCKSFRSEPFKISPQLVDDDERILIFPNPNPGSFNVAMFWTGETYTIRILNMLGHQVFEQTYNGFAEFRPIQLDVPAGTYILRFEDPNHTLNERLLIVR